ncbi:ATP-binding cassette domain-containing protein [Oceanotoga teriensis]|jgi:ATP-binding cassette subfamily B protein|uniref:ABC transporter family protein n=1 Tax=Oceanotoga teriensis TaxID=515440 RepID=A0AA45C5S6_9BACT|nr:ATP-binding cassette domain-containing protein [Oceanotoga teriensis]MDO7976403.1 ATP-binding cassette domain-containing protein [Oceanotoga teriensis]PWJ89333.1 ABC transporter family protein [Oceanotoga teriensis]
MNSLKIFFKNNYFNTIIVLILSLITGFFSFILSGGEKSRINIAQNLANEPEIIMIDESLTSVDEKMEYSIFENIVNNFKDKTILCISHRNSSKDMFDKEIKIF